jgi:DNA-binding GntR family transcriptional regulator
MGVALRKQSKPRSSATERVYQELKRQILTFQLLPGKVLEEHQVLQKLGFSRTPFREACMRLKEEGWLLSFSRRGYVITPITFEDIAGVYELRSILESACAQIAAMRATEAEIERLEEMIQYEERYRSVNGIPPDYANKNREFHLRIAEISRNTRMVNYVHSLLEQTLRFDYMLKRYAPPTSKSWTTHGAIVEAIKNHDSAQAGKRMQEHLKQAHLVVLSVMTTPPPDIDILPVNESAARWRLEGSDLASGA